MVTKGNTQADELLKTWLLVLELDFFPPPPPPTASPFILTLLLSGQGFLSVPDHRLPFFGFKEGISLTGVLIKGQGLSS